MARVRTVEKTIRGLMEKKKAMIWNMTPVIVVKT
jgi:hypothetical protein